MEQVDVAQPHDHASNQEILDHAQHLRWDIERLEARLVGQLAEIGRRRAFEEDGAMTMIGWLKNKCRMDTGRASQLAKLAQAEADNPELHRSHLDGQINSCEVRRIEHGAETIRRDLRRHGRTEKAAERAVDTVRSALLEAAEQGEGPKRLQHQIDSQRHQVAAESVAVDEWAAFQQRELRFYTTFDGMVGLRGHLDPVSAATVKTAVESLSKPSSKSEKLTTGQRQADALIQLAQTALEDGTVPTVSGHQPRINVTVSQATIAASRTSTGNTPAALRNHGSISGESARLLACDAEVSRIVRDQQSNILDVGRSTRTIPPAVRKALELRDGGCSYPDCDRPVEWCDAHHLKHWAHGGPTSLTNLTLLCRRHHTEVHLTATTITWEEGKLHFSQAPSEIVEPTRFSSTQRVDTPNFEPD